MSILKKGRCSVLLQLDMSYFIDTRRRPAPSFLNRNRRGVDGREKGVGEGIGRKEAGETMIRM